MARTMSSSLLFAAANAPLTGGAIAGTIIAVILLVICLVFTVGGFATGETGFGVGALTAAAAVVGAWVLFMWPLAYEYHHWIPTNGKVAAVSKRIVSDGDSIQEKYVLKFKDGRIRAVTDSAAGVLKVGDTVRLRCKKSYDFGVPRSAHGWDCKWAGTRL